MGADTAADFLRLHRERLAWMWEVEAQPVLRDYGDTLISALAEWLDGDAERAEADFARAADVTALQRLGYAGGLAALTRELAALRLVVARELSRAAFDERDGTSEVHASLDRAIAVAVKHYAEEREAARDRFIGILGHDLRDPLNAVIITARLLRRHARLREPAEHIEVACTRMMRLIGDVLDFARGHLGEGIPAHPELRDVRPLVRAVADEQSATSPERSITVALHGDLHADVDRERFLQALSNLVSNAIRHGSGAIEVSARESEDRRAIVTEVTSHGAPIPEPELARMFDPFVSVDPIGPRAGLGLGLYIVWQIARAHGATCSVRSTPDATTFAIRWPRAHAYEHAA